MNSYTNISMYMLSGKIILKSKNYARANIMLH